MESQTPNRIYGVLTASGKRLKSIVFINSNGKREREIDFLHDHQNLGRPHKHKGYIHREHGSSQKLTRKERRIVKKIYNYIQKSGILM